MKTHWHRWGQMFLCARPHGAACTCVHLSLTYRPPRGRHNLHVPLSIRQPPFLCTSQSLSSPLQYQPNSQIGTRPYSNLLFPNLPHNGFLPSVFLVLVWESRSSHWPVCPSFCIRLPWNLWHQSLLSLSAPIRTWYRCSLSAVDCLRGLFENALYERKV